MKTFHYTVAMARHYASRLAQTNDTPERKSFMQELVSVSLETPRKLTRTLCKHST